MPISANPLAGNIKIAQLLANLDQQWRDKSVDYRALMDSPTPLGATDDILKAVIYSPAVMAKMGKVIRETDAFKKALEFVKARYPRLSASPTRITREYTNNLGEYSLKDNSIIIKQRNDYPIESSQPWLLEPVKEYIETLAHELVHARQAKKTPEELLAGLARNKLRANPRNINPITPAMVGTPRFEAGKELTKLFRDNLYLDQPAEISARKAGETARKSFEDFLRITKDNY